MRVLSLFTASADVFKAFPLGVLLQQIMQELFSQRVHRVGLAKLAILPQKVSQTSITGQKSRISGLRVKVSIVNFQWP